MNKVILMGRLTRDPEYSQTPSGVAVTRFSIAVNRRFAKEGQQQADFINCTAWRQQAEFVYKYFKKGSMIALVGSIQTRSWDGADGKKQYATDVVVDEVHFTGSRAETGTSAGILDGDSHVSRRSEMNVSPANATEGFDDISFDGGSDLAFDDDLPF